MVHRATHPPARGPRPLRLESASADALTAARDSESLAAPDASQLHADVVRALEKLTDIQRDVLLAKIVDEQTFARIAEDQQMAVSTAKTHYLRAIRAMHAALGPRWRTEK